MLIPQIAVLVVTLCLAAKPNETRNRSPWGIREGQSLGRILETLAVASEFIHMPVLQEQLPALEVLRKDTLRCVHKQQRTRTTQAMA